MKKNDSGDFSVLYVEPGDDRSQLFLVIAEQKKPVVLMLTEPTLAFQRPDDFSSLKRVKRQLDLPIVFVIPPGGQLAQMAARNGFPVYLSMDSLADALSVGQLTRSRAARVTNPLSSGANHGVASTNTASAPKRTIPLRDVEPTPAYGAVALQKTSSSPHETIGKQEILSEAIDQHTTAPLHADAADDLNGNGRLHAPNGLNGNGYAPRTNSLNGIGQAPPVNSANSAQPSRQQTDSHNGAYGQVAIPARRVRVSSPLSGSGEFVRRRTDPLANHLPRVSVPLAALRAMPITPSRLTMPAPDNVGRGARLRPLPPLLVVLSIALVLGLVGAFLALSRSFQPSSTGGTSDIVGSLVFSNSENLSGNSAQGIADQATIDLSGISAPDVHKSYYAWLLQDKKQTDAKSLLLGKLPANNGKAHLFYAGDNQHTNLLLSMSRLLVTEEDAAVQPLAPSPDQSTWCFYGEFSSTPLPSTDGKQFSFLDHLRHLLASDPTLNELELPGGLNNWFYRNTGKIFEWTGSQRESWEDTKDTAFLRRQLIRTLEYLDGISFVSQDLPADTPILVNERLARIGLVQVNGPNQQPPSYMSHIVHHLNGLLQAGNETGNLRKKIAPIITALANVEQWLGKVRTDAQQLMKMTDDDLKQSPQTLDLIDDMVANANHAYTGETDPATHQMRQGATWIHQQMQTLATLTISKVVPSPNGATQPQMSGNSSRAIGPNGTKLAKN